MHGQYLLGRGWGWDMLAPWRGGNDWIPYKNYLKQYYLHNRPESFAQALQDERSRDSNVHTPLGSQETYVSGNGIGDGSSASYASGNDIGDGSAASYGAGNGIRDGDTASYGACNGIRDRDGLVPFVSWCVEMETQYIVECKKLGEEACGTADHILSKGIRERALSLKITGDEFPVTAAALMCTAKITELMLEGLRRGIDTGSVTKVRRYAFNLMKYRGSDYDCAAAVMVGIAKEAVAVCKCLRQCGQLDTMPWSADIIVNVSDILYLLDFELLPASNDNGTAATEAGSSPQITLEKDDKELGYISDEYDPETDPDRHAIRQIAEDWADSAPKYPKIGSLLLPPPVIFNYLDLVERGWGFKRLVPYFGNCWSAYKNYLQKYYDYNNPELVAQEWKNEKVDSAAGCNNSDGNGLKNGTENGGGLASIVSLCVNMEKKFVSECEKQGEGGDDAYHIILSKDIQKCALSLEKMDGRLPVSTAALMLITKKAELLCEWLKRGSCHPESMVMDVRQFALNLMLYDGSECTCAAAVMVGIANETKII